MRSYNFMRNSYIREMELGAYYRFDKKGKVYKFIKVTAKGYNFLDEETNEVRYIGRHYYKDKGIKNGLFIRFPNCVKFNYEKSQRNRIL